jgi:hypothetical protein
VARCGAQRLPHVGGRLTRGAQPFVARNFKRARQPVELCRVLSHGVVASAANVLDNPRHLAGGAALVLTSRPQQALHLGGVGRWNDANHGVSTRS